MISQQLDDNYCNEVVGVVRIRMCEWIGDAGKCNDLLTRASFVANRQNEKLISSWMRLVEPAFAIRGAVCVCFCLHFSPASSTRRYFPMATILWQNFCHFYKVDFRWEWWSDAIAWIQIEMSLELNAKDRHLVWAEPCSIRVLKRMDSDGFRSSSSCTQPNHFRQLR